MTDNSDLKTKKPSEFSSEGLLNLSIFLADCEGQLLNQFAQDLEQIYRLAKQIL